MGGYNTVVKLDVNGNADIVARCYAEETVERINIAAPGVLLALTLQGIKIIARAGKVNSDRQGALWLA